MLKKIRNTVLPAAMIAATLALAPTGHAAVGQMLNMLPSGAISCDQAASQWTNDADYQAKVAQAQAIAAMDPRGHEILAALGRVDAAASQCGLKGTTGAGAAGQAGDAGTTDGAGDSAGSGDVGGAGGVAEPANPVSSDDAPGVSAGGTGSVAPASGSGGTADTPVTDAEAVLGPIRNTPGTPTKTIEILGQGQVEVADADAMMSNFLRQFTIII